MSCVIVVHNYEAYVEATVRSALAQEGFGPDALEVIVVDDGSTDRTPAVLASFGDAITVLRQENSGPTVATNRALEFARGRYVALLDGDDEWLPDKLARQLGLFERRPEVALVHGDLEVVDGAGRVTNPSKYDWCGQLPVVGRALGRLLAANEATTSTIVVRTEVAKRLPPAPAWAWCRDWWIAAQVAARHEIDATRGPVARYRVHGSNVHVYEQLLWIAAPTVIVELGAQSGGSTLWLRDRLRTVAGYRAGAPSPLVISVDIDLSVARRNVASRDPEWADTIVFIEGNVCDAAVRAEVGRHLPPGAVCLVIEDSAHVESTTAAALELYSDLIPLGGFFVVEDGCVDVDWMRASEDWPRGVLPALTKWLATPQGSSFTVRRDLEVYGVSCHPSGFLQRVA